MPWKQPDARIKYNWSKKWRIRRVRRAQMSEIDFRRYINWLRVDVQLIQILIDGESLVFEGMSDFNSGFSFSFGGEKNESAWDFSGDYIAHID